MRHTALLGRVLRRTAAALLALGSASAIGTVIAAAVLVGMRRYSPAATVDALVWSGIALSLAATPFDISRRLASRAESCDTNRRANPDD